MGNYNCLSYRRHTGRSLCVSNVKSRSFIRNLRLKHSDLDKYNELKHRGFRLEF